MMIIPKAGGNNNTVEPLVSSQLQSQFREKKFGSFIEK